MGICVSCDAADEGAATARVVLPSGELREYAPPATAAMALEEVGGQGSWFLCDADGMVFEGPVAVAAVAPGEELQPGQIYFVLPAEMQRRRLTRDEVAKLAVKASSALVKAAAEAAAAQPSSPCRRRRRGAVAPLVFPVPEEEYAAADPVSPVSPRVAAAQKRRVACRGGRAATRFSPDLTAIPESE
ncbi:hypothetical protein SEVIR_9G075600v4 [Setaria viridis]|uniref:Uncharacterized protein n=2 Tax=Setaria TaxID=4554 RepID=K4AFL7_SETIT|nr:uncharacterized protein LOC101777691 [Setaria italica]XP_034572727.1 uncharacterized protein LOC117837244 [Setaria viridis]RCV40715.1 hypothetical protein SETIT_9G077200v2 [Setaria italica]TKV91151.1 hypothetical protein SEVIR_9G075600v2 [Setaria viridis]